ncbi:MAG: ABC transporter permease [Truepera sp.]|nr:ABC transporter permease [Truepera sp.]
MSQETRPGDRPAVGGRGFSQIPMLPELAAVASAFLVGALILWVTGHPVLDTFYHLLQGAFGSWTALGTTLTRATPLIFTGLAFAVAFKCGLFNIGAEGQLHVGALAAAWVGFALPPLPPLIHITLALGAGAVAGLLWAVIPAVLKVKRGVHEVVTTMMLAHVGILFTRYLVFGPLKAPGWIPHTERIAPTAELLRIMPPTQLSIALFIALLCALIVYLFLWKTVPGYEIRAAGLNPSAAQANGVPVSRSIMLALLLSGALAGIGGAGEILGVFRRFVDGFSPGYGWDGIAVGLLGRLHPIGVVLAAFLFGALHVGGSVVDRVTDVPLDITVIMQAMVILFIAAPRLMSFIRGQR